MNLQENYRRLFKGRISSNDAMLLREAKTMIKVPDYYRTNPPKQNIDLGLMELQRVVKAGYMNKIISTIKNDLGSSVNDVKFVSKWSTQNGKSIPAIAVLWNWNLDEEYKKDQGETVENVHRPALQSAFRGGATDPNWVDVLDKKEFGAVIKEGYRFWSPEDVLRVMGRTSGRQYKGIPLNGWEQFTSLNSSGETHPDILAKIPVSNPRGSVSMVSFDPSTLGMFVGELYDKEIKSGGNPLNALADVVSRIADEAQQNYDMTDDITDELGDFYDQVQDSGDAKLIKAYEKLRMTADGAPRAQAKAANDLLNIL